MTLVLRLFVPILLLGALFPGLAAAAEELRILSGGRLIPTSVVEAFEKAHSLQVRIENFESSEALSAYLENSSRGDLALLRGYQVDYLQLKNLLTPLDHRQLPNLKNLRSQALGLPVDIGVTHSVPYIYGSLGILYREDLFGGRKPGWNSIFDRRSGSTPFAMVDQYRDALGATLIYLGYPYNTASPSAIGQAAETLRDLAGHPAFMGFMDGDTLQRFFKERFLFLAVTYNNVAARAIEEDPSLAYAAPEPGVVSWGYAFVINKNSRQTEAAHQWLNYILEPEVAAEISVWNRAATQNQAALDFLPEAIRNNPVIYPPGELPSGVQVPVSLGEEAEELMIEYWSRLKQ